MCYSYYGYDICGPYPNNSYSDTSPLDSGQDIAFSWTIAPSDPSTTKCPSPSRILGTFAAVNIIVAIISVILGHDLIVHKLSCGLLGRSKKVTWQWIIPVGLNLGSSAVIAVLIKSRPGYGAGFEVGDLVLFYTARPRVAWIFASLSGLVEGRRRKKERVEDSESLYFPYVKFATSQVYAELVLMAITAYTMGTAAYFANTQGLYNVMNPMIYLDAQTEGARIMNGGALYWIIAFTWIMGWALVVAVATYLGKWREEVVPARGDSLWGFIMIPLIALPTLFLAQWLFIAGFVLDRGDK
jgi:hypothetical protein